MLIALIESEAESYHPTKKQEMIAQALEYVSKHYNEKLTNDILAEAAGMSIVYFRKLFTEIVGVSPINYVHRFRIEKAIKMLDADYGTLSDVAAALGYISLYDFSRDFKKHTGVPPSKYVRQI